MRVVCAFSDCGADGERVLDQIAASVAAGWVGGTLARKGRVLER